MLYELLFWIVEGIGTETERLTGCVEKCSFRLGACFCIWKDLTRSSHLCGLTTSIS